MRRAVQPNGYPATTGAAPIRRRHTYPGSPSWGAPTPKDTSMNLAQVAVRAQSSREVETSTEMRGGASAGVLAVIAVVSLALLALHIYVLVDILKHSDAAWAASGQNKTLWIVLWVVAFCCGGLIIDLIYWFAIRPKLTAAGGAGGAGGGYTGYAGPPPGA